MEARRNSTIAPGIRVKNMHQETDQGVDDRLGRLRPRTQSLKSALSTLDGSSRRKPVGQQEDSRMEIAAQESHPRWQWDVAGRWI